MLRPKTIAWFFAKLLLCYGLLIVPWPGWKDAFAAGFQACGNALFHSVGNGGTARFQPMSEGPNREDTEIVLRGPRGGGRIRYSAWVAGYMPAATFLALLLATPLPWRRRLTVVLPGLLLIGGFALLRVALPLWRAFDGPALGALALNEFWKIVMWALHSVARQTSVSYIVPVFVWMLLLVRKRDLEALGMRWEAARGDEKKSPAAHRPAKTAVQSRKTTDMK